MEIKYLNLPSTSRIHLEPLSLVHLEDFHELWDTEEGVRYTTRLVLKDLNESRAFMSRVLKSEEGCEIDKFAIVLKQNANSNSSSRSDPDLIASDSKPEVGTETETKTEAQKKLQREKCIGMLGTNRWSEQGLETGYSLNKSYWGKGYATEAFALFLRYYWGLEERKTITHLVAKTHPDNKASERVLIKCGGRKGESVWMKRPDFKGKGKMTVQSGGHEGQDGKVGNLEKDGKVEKEEKDGKLEEEEEEGHEVMCWYFDRPGYRQWAAGGD